MSKSKEEGFAEEIILKNDIHMLKTLLAQQRIPK